MNLLFVFLAAFFSRADALCGVYGASGCQSFYVTGGAFSIPKQLNKAGWRYSYPAPWYIHTTNAAADFSYFNGTVFLESLSYCACQQVGCTYRASPTVLFDFNVGFTRFEFVTYFTSNTTYSHSRTEHMYSRTADSIAVGLNSLIVHFIQEDLCGPHWAYWETLF